MGVWSAMRRWFDVASQPAAELVAMDAPTPSRRFSVDVPPELLEAMTVGGVLARRVSRDEALQVPAVMRARNIIAGTLSTLPIRFHDRSRAVAEPTSLLRQIDPDVPNAVTLANTYEDLLFHGLSWWRVTNRGWHGYPTNAQHVPRESVHVAGTGDLPSVARISPDVPFPATGQVFIDGVPVPDSDIIRFDSPNPPLLEHAARAIRVALRLDRTAADYAENPMPQGILTDKPESPSTYEDDEIDQLLDDWATARRRSSWAYLGDLQAQTLQWSPEQLQLADARQHAVLEIARATGIDPEDLGVSTTTRTYANAESRRLALLDFTLAAYVRTVEQRLSMRDLLPQGYYARIDFAGFLRSDTLTRMQTYEVGLRVGAYTRDEIRQLEDKPPLTAAERAESQPAPQTTTDAPAADEEGMNTMPQSSTVHFESGAQRISFDAAEIGATFRVNPDKRTISGLIVPWGKVADNGMGKWRFAEDSLYWTDETRVKLNLHHDSTQAVAYAQRLQHTSAGIDATFKVADVPEGDRALKLAQGKVLDGFSVEVELSDGYEPDPQDRSVNLVTRGHLRGVALTGTPAFDDARATAVAASRNQQEGKTMGDSPTGSPAAVQQDFSSHMSTLAEQITESHKNLTSELAASLGESISEGFKAALDNMPSPQDGPGTVRASRYTVGREAPVYSLNGNGPSLMRDAWYAAREQDHEAQERLRKFRVQCDEVAKLAASAVNFQQGTGDLGEVIPPGYRPDLFVPELAQGRPLVGLCSRGAIANATPFLVPTFGSATGATDDHTEGENPSDGTLSLGEETVSPGAISGRLTLTREIVDSSNPAIDQIALAAMRESYNRQTEQKVYDALNGEADTTFEWDDDSTTGNINDVRDLLAQYPFTRFAAPTGAAMNQKVTRAFATAVDGDDRPLLPSVGAQNTAGLGNAVDQGWFIDGLTFVPAWSITDDDEDDVLLIVNRADVWVWESPLLTFRFEEKQGPANIELNVFGYFATHVLRPAGVFAARNEAAA